MNFYALKDMNISQVEKFTSDFRIIAEFFRKEQAKTSDCIRKYCPENPTRLYQTGREHAISDLIRKLEIHDKKDVEE